MRLDFTHSPHCPPFTEAPSLTVEVLPDARSKSVKDILSFSSHTQAKRYAATMEESSDFMGIAVEEALRGKICLRSHFPPLIPWSMY